MRSQNSYLLPEPPLSNSNVNKLKKCGRSLELSNLAQTLPMRAAPMYNGRYNITASGVGHFWHALAQTCFQMQEAGADWEALCSHMDRFFWLYAPVDYSATPSQPRSFEQAVACLASFRCFLPQLLAKYELFSPAKWCEGAADEASSQADTTNTNPLHGWESIELGVRLLNLHKQIPYDTHVDFVMWDKEQRQPVVLDMKTTGMISEVRTNQLHSNQLLGYLAGVCALLHKANKAKWRAIGGHNCFRTYRVWYMSISTKNATSFTLSYGVTDQRIIEWDYVLRSAGERIAEERKHLGRLSRDTTECRVWHQTCQHVNVCDCTNEEVVKFIKPYRSGLEQPQIEVDWKEAINLLLYGCAAGRAPQAKEVNTKGE